MRTLGNIIWVSFGGIILAVVWVLCAIICFCSIVGIPIGVQCLKFARFVLWPFGSTIKYSGSNVHFAINLIWILLFGWELALLSFVIGLIWCITIIGIPFGVQSIKFSQLAFMPFGAEII